MGLEEFFYPIERLVLFQQKLNVLQRVLDFRGTRSRFCVSKGKERGPGRVKRNFTKGLSQFSYIGIYLVICINTAKGVANGRAIPKRSQHGLVKS